MRIQDILSEAPLPDDWDKAIYNPLVAFKKRVEYAKERAEKIGQGSSRIAFIIDYQGRQTVLKVAKNRKGMAQNQVESDILSDGYFGRLSCLIPIIDYDETSSSPTWVHTEKAEKANEKTILRLLGLAVNPDIYFRDLYYYIDSERRGVDTYHKNLMDDVREENEYLADLYDLFMNSRLEPADITIAANWGVYQGRPVLIDVGYDDVVRSTYYAR